jgi:hypothetical protein
MDRVARHRLASLALAALAGGGLYWFAGDLALAAVAGVVWGVALLVTLRTARRFPGSADERGWTGRRWSALGTGVLTLAAVVGVGPTLPVSSELRLGLGVLVAGVGYVGHATGRLTELDRAGEE